MDIKSIGQSPETFGKSVQTARAEHSKTDGPFGQVVSEMAHARKLQNAAILEASASASLSAGNEPLSLVLKTALENINAALKEAMGEDNVIETAVEQGVDVSPAATADRIVSQSTAFFEQYKANHPDMNEEEAKANFIDLIRGGVEKGFAEARSLLDGLNVLAGDVAANIDKTYELVQQGLDDFLNGEVIRAAGT